MLVLAVCINAPAQDDASAQEQSAPPPAATGPVDQNLENPPVTGLDRPQSEPAFGGRSYFAPGAQASEGLDSNANGSAHGSSKSSVTRLAGSADLQKLWRKYQIGLDYLGGVAGYSGPLANSRGHFYQMHTIATDQRIPWRTGQLAIRDSFEYLPEGSFGLGSFGGAGAVGTSGGLPGTGLGGGITGGSSSSLFSGGQYGGVQSRYENFAIADVTQELSARSSVTLAGGFDYTKFPNSKTLINSQETLGQVGYNHLLNRKDQVGVFYAFQELHFPVPGSGTVETQVWNGLYAHRITGKLNLVVGAGPEIVQVRTPPSIFLFLGIPIKIPGSTTRTVSGTGTATVTYTASARTAVNFSFVHYVTTGSGFFAGANTTAARAALTHGFGRKWNGGADLGYSRNTRLQSLVSGAGSSSQAYHFWYAGVSLRRQLGPHFDVFGNYQFDHFGTTCTASSPICGSHQHLVNLGIEWHPKPIRLD